MSRLAYAARLASPAALVAAGLALSGCRDNASKFSNTGDHYEGNIVTGSFVRSGLQTDARMCIVLDGARLQDAPGTITTSDGRFKNTPLRPIPQVWHDPLSTFSFGEGRLQNLMYVATPTSSDASDVFVFVSLMEEGGVEARLVRGAPQADAGAPAATQDAGDGGDAGGVVPLAPSSPVFGVFVLDRREGVCSF